MRNCLLPASGFRVNVDNRYPVEEEGRVSPHEELGQLLDEAANCLVLILARLSYSASEFSSFSKCFGNRFFCIFCKPHTYSHPFLPTLVSYKKIWPIYGFVHFSVTKKRAKLGSNLKHLINENFRFQSSIYDFFLLNTSHSEDMRQKNPN